MINCKALLSKFRFLFPL